VPFAAGKLKKEDRVRILAWNKEGIFTVEIAK
jgi:hypothetical protein